MWGCELGGEEGEGKREGGGGEGGERREKEGGRREEGLLRN